MAITMRRGSDANFDPTKLVPGELAVLNTTKKIAVAFADGTVKYMQTEEDAVAYVEQAKNAADSASEDLLYASNFAAEANQAKEDVVNIKNNFVNIPRTFYAKCTGVTDGAMNLTSVTTIDRPFIAGDELFITFSSNANITSQLFTINSISCRVYNKEEFFKYYHEDDHVSLKCDGDYDLQGGKDFFVEGVAAVDKIANVAVELFGSANTSNTDVIDTTTEIVTASAEITV